MATAESDKNHVINVFTKKIKKIEKYREKFERVGLAVLVDIPLCLIIDSKWGGWLTDINNGSFDFAVLIHWFGTEMYSFASNEYHSSRICREDVDALKILARLTAEEIISDKDEIWGIT